MKIEFTGMKGGQHCFKKGALTYRFSEDELAQIVGYAVRMAKANNNKTLKQTNSKKDK
ncbi:hypothetical protein [Escherichia phage PJNS034]